MCIRDSFSMEQGIVVGITPDRDGTSKDTELPLLTTRKFTTHLTGGPKIRILDAKDVYKRQARSRLSMRSSMPP